MSSYYNKLNNYVRNTKARVEHVSAEFVAIEASFDLLPTPHATPGAGFAATVAVNDATAAGHAMAYGQFQTWTVSPNANSQKITGLAAGTASGNSVNYDQYISWSANIDANGKTLTGLPTASGADTSEAANVAYVNSVASLGGSPGSVPITDLDNGTATAGQLLAIDGSGNVVGINSRTDFTTVSSGPRLAVDGEQLACDTSGGSFTVNLPASPTAGETRVTIMDLTGSFSTYPLTIGRNTKNIMGLAEDMVINTDNVVIDLIYIDATNGWRIA